MHWDVDVILRVSAAGLVGTSERKKEKKAVGKNVCHNSNMQQTNR